MISTNRTGGTASAVFFVLLVCGWAFRGMTNTLTLEISAESVPAVVEVRLSPDGPAEVRAVGTEPIRFSILERGSEVWVKSRVGEIRAVLEVPNRSSHLKPVELDLAEGDEGEIRVKKDLFGLVGGRSLHWGVSHRPTHARDTSRVTMRMETFTAGRVDLDSIQITVPLSETPWEGGRCDGIPPVPNARDADALSMVWDQGGVQSRRLTVTFNGRGDPVNYSDVRGALGTARSHAGSDGLPGQGTLISINLERKQAMVRNQERGGIPEAFLVDFHEALESEKLGHPARAIEHLFSQCAGERP